MQKIRSLSFVILFGVVALGLTIAPARAAVILNVVGGQLTGAQNVDVLGTLYDVTFVDGTCIALFNGCDATTDFTFGGSETAATAAAQALLDQVFIDGPLGQFDSSPALTLGCSSDSLGCSSLIPWAFNADSTLVVTLGAINTTGGDATATIGISPLSDLSSVPIVETANVYVAFAPAVVPLPPAVLLFGSGLVALFGYARFGLRRRRQV